MALLVGTCLPDLVHKGMNVLLRIPPEYALPAHTPIGILALSLLLCFVFVEDERRGAFIGLLAGGLLHILLDSLKSYLGLGGTVTGFPFSWEMHGFPLYQPENGIYATGPVVAVAVLVEMVLVRRRRSPR